MSQHVLIHAPLAETATRLKEALELIVPGGQGFQVILAAQPAPYSRMRFHAKGGPDHHEPVPPLAREAALEVWHTNHRDAYYRCAVARLKRAALPAARGQAGARAQDREVVRNCEHRGNGKRRRSNGEGCELSWEIEDIRFDFVRDWRAMLETANRILPMDLCTARLLDDPLYVLPATLAEVQAFASLPDLDRATKACLDRVFKPGSLRYERIPEGREGGDLVRYRIQGDLRDGGDFGEIWLRAGGADWTSMTLCVLGMSYEEPGERERILALPPEQQAAVIAALEAPRSVARQEQLAAKAAYLATVWECCHKSYPPHWLSPLRADAAEDLARSVAGVTEIEAEVLDRWCADETGREIAAAAGLTEPSVYNMISDLRKRLGPDLVPYRNRRKSP